MIVTIFDSEFLNISFWKYLNSKNKLIFKIS